jgi:hypothetical protein
MARSDRNPPTEAHRPTTSGNAGDPVAPNADRGLGPWIRDKVSRELTSRKNRVSDRLDGVAQRVRRIGEPAPSEPLPGMAVIADDAAKRLEQVAEGLRERDLEELAEDVRGFAKSRPAVFIGAGLAAGLIAGRFLRSSAAPAEASAPQRSTGPDDKRSRGMRPDQSNWAGRGETHGKADEGRGHGER